jgi:hypothetical protein
MNTVFETLLEAFVWAFIVVLISLQHWRATLPPMIDVPVHPSPKLRLVANSFRPPSATIFTTMPPGTSPSPITSADAGRQARRGATGYRPC